MKHLQLHFDRGIETVTLDRPDVRNAFNDEVIAELTAVFLEIGKRAEVRCVVLAANGPAFCAGADATGLARMLEVIFACPKPTIAKVQGDVYAGGTGLVAACDIAVSVDTATYCLSETRLGLIPATISPYVIRAMGEQAARRYFVTAERFGAAEARACGLAHEVCAAAAIDEVVGRLADAIVANAPLATRACKRLVRDVAGREIDAGLRADTARRIADIRVSAEGREGIQSFLDKRKPGWLAP